MINNSYNNKNFSNITANDFKNALKIERLNPSSNKMSAEYDIIFNEFLSGSARMIGKPVSIFNTSTIKTVTNENVNKKPNAPSKPGSKPMRNAPSTPGKSPSTPGSKPMRNAPSTPGKSPSTPGSKPMRNAPSTPVNIPMRNAPSTPGRTPMQNAPSTPVRTKRPRNNQSTPVTTKRPRTMRPPLQNITSTIRT